MEPYKKLHLFSEVGPSILGNLSMTLSDLHASGKAKHIKLDM